MQPTVVSKRPPRALLIALAALVGASALGVALLPGIQGGGLATDRTYLGLLGYTPSETGSSLSASGDQEAQEGRVLLSSHWSPAATPEPPAVTARVASPTEAPADAATEGASEADRDPNPLGPLGPAVDELNESRENLTQDPLDSLGLGVLPEDAAQVPGAPSLERFVKPEVDEDRCTWTKETNAQDANGDGHPEHVQVRMLGTCLFDDPSEGIAEARMRIARDVHVWDNDSNGVFNALEARQGLEAYVDTAGNGTHEYEARALWTLSLTDSNEDKAPEILDASFAGEQAFDRAGDGNVEFVRTAFADVRLRAQATDDVPNSLNVSLRVIQSYDVGDDGGQEYEGLLQLDARTVDANHDGANESASLRLTGYETLDRDLDGNAERARGVEASFERIDENSNGYAERTSVGIYLYGRVDPTSDGVLEVRRALELFDVIQSVDSLLLAETLERRAEAAGRVVPVLLEVNVAREPRKHGFAPEDLAEVARRAVNWRALRVEGLMTVAPLVDEQEAVRPVFRALRELGEGLREILPGARELSMGMTDDFEVAVEEGATMVRLGRALFGPRLP